jgi:hypothetical protein
VLLQIEILGPADDDRFRHVVRLLSRILAANKQSAFVTLTSDFQRMIDVCAFVPPAVMVNGRLRSVGRVPAVAEVCDWLNQVQAGMGDEPPAHPDDEASPEEKT